MFEAVGDAQLSAFRADPANKGKVLSTGLWRYTRHPNYFGDACVWWGIWIASASAGWWVAAATVIGPLFLTFTLTRWSGAPLLEGAYSLWVRELLRALPAEQIRVVLAEDLQRRPAELLAELRRFLGLPSSRGREQEPNPGPSSPWAGHAARAAPLPAATRKELREFYAGFNEELAHFMDDDPRFLWHER